KKLLQSVLVEGGSGSTVTVVALDVGDGVRVLHDLNEPHLVTGGQAHCQTKGWCRRYSLQKHKPLLPVTAPTVPEIKFQVLCCQLLGA
uniref:Uncharacterized protein n=1 Tax=Scophthalmus maximus TaxID=52904 RepID=A0A8D3B724_SCOMX